MARKFLGYIIGDYKVLNTFKSPHCPKCHNSMLNRSRQRGIGDLLMRLLWRRPARCGACDKRYYIPARLLAEIPVAKKNSSLRDTGPEAHISR
jgi:hypothetical protein